MNSKSILSVIKKYDMLPHGGRVVVGLSGGADSVSLLHVLNELRDELNITLTAVHVNHGIRGEEAYRDEQFCKTLCESLGIELRSFHFDIPALSKQRKLSEEECGRNVRYEVFRSVAGEGGTIATAHNLNDNAETVLLNITRGTGNKGICGIPPKRGNIIRPLIETDRKQIEQYISDNNLTYVTDSTNLNSDYSRNKIRNRVLPVLEEINPSVLSSFQRLISSANEDEAFLSEKVKEAYIVCCKDNRLDENLLLSYPVNIRKRVIAAYLSDNTGSDASSVNINNILNIVGNKKSVTTLGGLKLRSRGGFIETVTEEPEGEWSVGFPLQGGEAELPVGNKRIKVTVKKDLQKLNKELLDNLIDCDKICNTAVLRSRREGDRFNLRKRNVTKSLKKLFNEEKIPPEKRNSLAVLSDGENVVWVESFGVSGRYAVNKNTKNAVEINVIWGQDDG